jgi:hypothetical protein
VRRGTGGQHEKRGHHKKRGHREKEYPGLRDLTCGSQQGWQWRHVACR